MADMDESNIISDDHTQDENRRIHQAIHPADADKRAFVQAHIPPQPPVSAEKEKWAYTIGAYVISPLIILYGLMCMGLHHCRLFGKSGSMVFHGNAAVAFGAAYTLFGIGCYSLMAYRKDEDDILPPCFYPYMLAIIAAVIGIAIAQHK